MSLSELTTIAGTVSAIAVLFSLRLIKRQIRQSEKNQRALIQQGRASRSAEVAMRLMASDFAEAYHRCMNGDTEITEIQLVQFMGYCRAVFLGAEDSYLQHREYLLDELAFNSFKSSLLGLFMSPGMRATWAILREWFDAEFAAFMDGVSKEAIDRPYSVHHTQWKAAVSTEAGFKKAA